MPLVQAEAELAIRDVICEVQITSIASHVFNELEHDIRYKTRGVEPGVRVHRTLEDLQHASRLLDTVVGWLQDERAREIDRSQRAISRVLPIRGDEARRNAAQQAATRRHRTCIYAMSAVTCVLANWSPTSITDRHCIPIMTIALEYIPLASTGTIRDHESH